MQFIHHPYISFGAVNIATQMQQLRHVIQINAWCLVVQSYNSVPAWLPVDSFRLLYWPGLLRLIVEIKSHDVSTFPSGKFGTHIQQIFDESDCLQNEFRSTKQQRNITIKQFVFFVHNNEQNTSTYVEWQHFDGNDLLFACYNHTHKYENTARWRVRLVFC